MIPAYTCFALQRNWDESASLSVVVLIGRDAVALLEGTSLSAGNHRMVMLHNVRRHLMRVEGSVRRLAHSEFEQNLLLDGCQTALADNLWFQIALGSIRNGQLANLNEKNHEKQKADFNDRAAREDTPHASLRCTDERVRHVYSFSSGMFRHKHQEI